MERAWLTLSYCVGFSRDMLDADNSVWSHVKEASPKRWTYQSFTLAIQRGFAKLPSSLFSGVSNISAAGPDATNFPKLFDETSADGGEANALFHQWWETQGLVRGDQESLGQLERLHHSFVQEKLICGIDVGTKGLNELSNPFNNFHFIFADRCWSRNVRAKVSLPVSAYKC